MTCTSRIATLFLISLTVVGCVEATGPESRTLPHQEAPTAALVPGESPVVVVRQGAGDGETTEAGAPVVDNLADALGLVASDGLIRVMPGTYPTLELDIRRPVTIEGQGEGPLLVAAPSDEPTRAFTVVADGSTTIRNLRFEGYTDPIQVSEFGVDDAYDMVLIDNVHIELGEGFTSGVSVFPPTLHDDGRTVRVQNSTIAGGWRGLHVMSDVPDFVAVGNTLTGQKLPSPTLASAIAFSDGASGRIEGNLLTDCEECIHVGGGVRTRGAVDIVGNRITIDIAEAIPNVITASGLRLSIRDNVVTGKGGARDPSDPTTWPINSTGIGVESAGEAELRNNRVSGAWTGYGIGRDIGKVTGLDNAADQVRTGFLSFGVDGTLTFRSSDFTDYHVSLHVDGTGMDLTCNWWGSTAGPRNVSGQVSSNAYTPWATEPVAGTSTTSCGGGL